MFWAYEAGGDFVYIDGGREYTIPAAVDVHFETLVEVLRSDLAFWKWSELRADLPLGVVSEVRDAYCIHQGLPLDPADVEQMFAMLGRYGSELEIDLRDRGIDLISDFRERRWRRIINAIDHLPYASHFRERMLNDPEMVEMIMKRQMEQEKDGKKKSKSGIPVSEYTRVVGIGRDLIQEIRSLRAVVLAVAGGGSKPPEPYEGPITLLKEAEFNVRQAQHDSLVARVLPGKAAGDGQ